MKTATENQPLAKSPFCYASLIPKTDEAWDAYQMDSTCEEGDPWGLAARLERENTALKREIMELIKWGGFIDLSHAERLEALVFSHNAEHIIGEEILV